ncbi:MAG: hypothetical protein JO320_05310 [Alphaproteobacteria bacterium]|nr:hypothetical protein [Alphaproteobacteria bacterium]
MPNVILTAEGGDRRLPLPMLLLAIGATDLRASSRSQRVSFILAASMMFVFRVAEVQARWSADQAIYADVWQGLSLLPAGARVASAFPPGSFDDFSLPGVAVFYIPVWGIIPRGGFTQTLFAYPSQHPLVLKPKYEALAAATPPGLLWRTFAIGTDVDRSAAPNPELVGALHDYDFIAFIGRNHFSIHNTAIFRSFYDGQYVRIFRLHGVSLKDVTPQGDRQVSRP